MPTAHILEAEERTDDIKVDKNFKFEHFLLSPQVLDGLKQSGFIYPSPIQQKSIPLAKCGVDLVCQAKSGTGKTCVFAVTALEAIDVNLKSVQVLVLAPTREIAAQIRDVIIAIGSSMKGLRCSLLIGGIAESEDIENLKGCHIVVGTPGRVKSLIEKSIMRVSSIRLFVLDEADKLLESSLQDQVNWIFSTLPNHKQTLALSATFPSTLSDFLNNYMKEPTHVRINPQDLALKGVKQYFCDVQSLKLQNKVFEKKTDVLIKLLQHIPFNQCMVFSNVQARAEHLCNILTKHGWPSTFIAGKQAQSVRLKAMEKLKKFDCRILVTTDLTSRGIDCEKVNLVINLDVPWDTETYLHRIGRAGRFGSHATAVSIISHGKECEKLKTICMEMKKDIQHIKEYCNRNGEKEAIDIGSSLLNKNDSMVWENLLLTAETSRQTLTNGESCVPEQSIDKVSSRSDTLNEDTEKIGHSETENVQNSASNTENFNITSDSKTGNSNSLYNSVNETNNIKDVSELSSDTDQLNKHTTNSESKHTKNLSAISISHDEICVAKSVDSTDSSSDNNMIKQPAASSPRDCDNSDSHIESDRPVAGVNSATNNDPCEKQNDNGGLSAMQSPDKETENFEDTLNVSQLESKPTSETIPNKEIEPNVAAPTSKKPSYLKLLRRKGKNEIENDKNKSFTENDQHGTEMLSVNNNENSELQNENPRSENSSELAATKSSQFRKDKKKLGESASTCISAKCSAKEIPLRKSKKFFNVMSVNMNILSSNIATSNNPPHFLDADTAASQYDDDFNDSDNDNNSNIVGDQDKTIVKVEGTESDTIKTTTTTTSTITGGESQPIVIFKRNDGIDSFSDFVEDNSYYITNDDGHDCDESDTTDDDGGDYASLSSPSTCYDFNIESTRNVKDLSIHEKSSKFLFSERNSPDSSVSSNSTENERIPSSHPPKKTEKQNTKRRRQNRRTRENDDSDTRYSTGRCYTAERFERYWFNAYCNHIKLISLYREFCSKMR